MHFFNSQQVHKLFNYKEFVPFLEQFLRKEVHTPNRSHFSIPVPNQRDATLLTMPSWSIGEYYGVKVVSVFPENLDLPTINGTYLLMDGLSGKSLGNIDGLTLTIKRTAAVSALASKILSPEKARSLLMIGTGNLCHELIRAHASVRNLDRVWIWGRNFAKAKAKAASLSVESIEIEAVEHKESVIPQADIVSCATFSTEPLVYGDLLKDGFYLDLVGSYKKDAREADDQCLKNANIYVDTLNALEESGDLYIPLKENIITEKSIRSDLTTLCKSQDLNPDPTIKNTYFKSVGFAAPDLAAAIYLYQKLDL